MAEQSQKTTNVSAITDTTKTGGSFVAKKAVVRAIGSLAPGAGKAATEVAIKTAQTINKVGKKLGLIGHDIKDTAGRMFRFGVAFAVSLALTAVIYAIVALVVLTILTVFIMYVINTGSYMVPFRNTGVDGEFVDFGEIEVGASCPIPGGVVLWGSYGSPYSNIGHGTNAYWNATSTSCSAYTIPEYSSCYSKKPGDYCYNQASSCSFYGYAADFIYPNVQRAGQPIYLPYINGESVAWTVVTPRGNHAGLLRANQGGRVYEMNLIHLETNPRGGQSGSVTGVLQNYRTPHVHVELRVDGEYVPPEFMCTGGDAGGGVVPVEPKPACSSINGECISTPSCGRMGRTQLNGSCSGGVNFLCCSRQTVNTNSCQTGGGICYTEAVLGILSPGATTCEQAGLAQSPGACSALQLCCRSTQN